MCLVKSVAYDDNSIHIVKEKSCKIKVLQDFLPSFENSAERGGFEPPVQITPYGSLANCWFQPLTHLSGKALKAGQK